MTPKIKEMNISLSDLGPKLKLPFVEMIARFVLDKHGSFDFHIEHKLYQCPLALVLNFYMI
jgi:hypothetical protein